MLISNDNDITLLFLSERSYIMAKKREKESIFKKLHYKYRISIFNEDTIEEVWRGRLSRFMVMSTAGVIAFVSATIVILLFFFTPVKEYIPGYPSGQMRKDIISNAILADSLQRKLERQADFFIGIKNILEGNIPEELKEDTAQVNHEQLFSNLHFTPSAEDSIFREYVEDEEKYNLQVLVEHDNSVAKDEELLLILPVKGVIVSVFDAIVGHYGIDLVTAPEENILSVSDGTVILCDYTLNTGYIIGIMHDNNLISIYKHNSRLTKEVGDKVKAGDIIAVVGNTGELTTGPHLHLELWRNGEPIDPQKYIVF